MYGWLILTGVLISMTPATRKTTVRGPSASQAARKLPGPESSRLVTAMTRPPRPPGVNAPPPSAPGNAGSPGRRAGAGSAHASAASTSGEQISASRCNIVPASPDASAKRREPPSINAPQPHRHVGFPGQLDAPLALGAEAVALVRLDDELALDRGRRHLPGVEHLGPE